jgi:hypothetical protein
VYVKAGQEVTACREHDAAMLLPAPTRFFECAKGDERVCVKTRVWYWPGWTPASAGVTALDLGAVLRPVIPAKAGIHEFSHRLERPAKGTAALQTQSLSPGGKQEENSSKMKQRGGNVYENKEPPWKTC